MKLERYFSALLLLASLFLLYIAWGYTAPISYDPLGPRPYPVLILSLLALCTFYLTIRPKTETLNLGYTAPLLKKLGLCLISLVVYATIFEILGFVGATALMAFAVGKLFGGSTLKSAISGVVLGVGLYLLFDLALDVPLPLGLLG